MFGKTYEVGIYCRLSRDDRERQVVSMSIASQKMLLSNFVNGKGWIIKQIYEDDGFSGTDFKRPGFAKMLQDIEKGRINCVVTKDLSRIVRC